MADEIVSINNLKENLLEFELTVKGLSEENFDTKFVIHSANMEMAFPCKKGENNKWSVTLPPLPMLERTAYPFHLQVVAEGFQFRPLRGSVNVVGSPEVYASASVTNAKLESPTKPVEAPRPKTEAVAPPKAQPTKQREKSIQQVASELMESKSAKQPDPAAETPAPVEVAAPKKTAVKENLLPTIEKSEPKKLTEKDQAVLDILEQAGARRKPQKPRKRFSLKN